MCLLRSKVLFLSVALVICVIPKIHTQNVSRYKGLHGFNAVGVLQEFASDIDAFEDVRSVSQFVDTTTIINLLSKLGVDKYELIDLLVRGATDKCLQDLIYTIKSIPDLSNMWALKMVDSYGKLNSGILSGNFKAIGDFNECIQVYAPPKGSSSVGNFYGQYCALQGNLNLSNIPVPVSFGICLPDSCNSDNLKHDVQKLINITGLEPYEKKIESIISITSLDCKPKAKQYTTAYIVMTFIISFFLFLASVGTSITVFEYIRFKTDYLSYGKDFVINGQNETETYRNISEDDDDVLILKGNSNQSGGYTKAFFKCFCILSNGQKLFDTSSTEGQMLSIHGIRFLSMSWVIVCHMYGFAFGNISNSADVKTLCDTWPFLVIIQGFYSVDSFFVLSGFLLAYLFFQEMKKRDGKMSCYNTWLPFYIHRYIRLTPVYMIMLGFSTAIFPYLGSGPFWPEYEIEPICQKNWWWNILYINNFAPATKQCFGWAWYLANDMQFFAISPLFLITLWRWPKIGFSLLGAAFVATFASNFAITYYYDLMSSLAGAFDSTSMLDFITKYSDYMQKIYIKPYTRIGPYLVGILLGYYLFKKEQNPPVLNRWSVLISGWIISTGLTLLIIFGVYHRDMSTVENGFYSAFNRTCYAVCLAWVIYACLTGQGGPVNAILSYKFFMPLGRLTYTAYLIHPLVLTGYISNLKDTFVFSHITMVTLFFGLLVMTYLLSIAVSLLFESPIIRLEKLLRGKK